MKKNIAKKPTKELTVLITFLKRTKKGEYARIEKSSSKYSRLNEHTEIHEDEAYYYGLS